jgi:peptidoglycan hydrolase-like protein with peptidoglycan-binding domain
MKPLQGLTPVRQQLSGFLRTRSPVDQDTEGRVEGGLTAFQGFACLPQAGKPTPLCYDFVEIFLSPTEKLGVDKIEAVSKGWKRFSCNVQMDYLFQSGMGIYGRTLSIWATRS